MSGGGPETSSASGRAGISSARTSIASVGLPGSCHRASSVDPRCNLTGTTCSVSSAAPLGGWVPLTLESDGFTGASDLGRSDDRREGPVRRAIENELHLEKGAAKSETTSSTAYAIN